MPRQLDDFKVLTFDCYGTLIDWETGLWDALQPLLAQDRDGRVSRPDALAAFARLEDEIETAEPGLPYPDLLAEAHRRLAGHFGLETTGEADRAFGGSLPHWPAFPDTAAALRFLKSRYRLVVLSNVDREGFAASNRKLGVRFDAVYTAEDIGSYKPADANFEYLLGRLDRDFGFGREQVLHTAQSLYHDHVPARKFGIANAWIDRQRLLESGNWGAVTRLQRLPEFDFRFVSMGEMADAVRTGGRAATAYQA